MIEDVLKIYSNRQVVTFVALGSAKSTAAAAATATAAASTTSAGHHAAAAAPWSTAAASLAVAISLITLRRAVLRRRLPLAAKTKRLAHAQIRNDRARTLSVVARNYH